MDVAEFMKEIVLFIFVTKTWMQFDYAIWILYFHDAILFKNNRFFF